MPQPDYLFNHFPSEEIKAWRSAQAEAKRPSGLNDFLKAHDICPVCRLAGQNITNWVDDETPCWSACETCGGTGKVTHDLL